MTIVDIQFSPAATDWPTLRAATIEAEAVGFGAVWVFDHLAGVSLGGTTMIEAFTLLGALAEVTERVELGAMVANVWNRQVGTLVTAAASVATLSARQFHLGVGAGAAPTSRWAIEQHAVGALVEPSLGARHARVEAVLTLCEREWAADREERFATFPRPAPRPTRIVGVNSVELSELAGRLADGVNIPWHHPRRREFLEAANRAAGDRPFLRTAYATYDAAMFDPDHPERVDMTACRIDRLVLAQFGPPEPPDRSGARHLA